MRKAIMVLMIMAIAGAAYGQSDSDANSIGVYFDEDALVYCATPGITSGTVFLCVTNISESSGISGWECNVEIAPLGAYSIYSWTPRGSYINVATPPDFVVGLGSPLPWAPSIVLLDIYMTILEYTPIYFTVHPASPTSFSPPSPGYLEANTNNLVPLGYSVGSESICAIINGDCGVVGVEDQTWGGVKALYR
jgi:hypothetical protein